MNAQADINEKELEVGQLCDIGNLIMKEIKRLEKEIGSTSDVELVKADYIKLEILYRRLIRIKRRLGI